MRSPSQESPNNRDRLQYQQQLRETLEAIPRASWNRPTVAPNRKLILFGRLLLLELQLVLVLVVVMTLTPRTVDADWLMDCGDCHCKWNSGKKTADCKNLSLAAVPENLSNEVQVLDLSLNRIVYLEPNAFLTAQLHNLHKLYIRNSTLQQIDPRTFTQLEILIELDLSNNLLRSLQPDLFGRLVKVRAIVLNGNLLESLGDGVFQNLKYLHKIELKDNRLVRIATATFVNVPLLSQIYLNGNRLNFLRKESFETLKRLTALSLDGNPWNCTCELQLFRDFVLRHNLYTPPTACHYPAHLRGMLWVEDLPEAFACRPRIIYPARGASINTSKENVTLICRVHASPNTHIAWDYNKQQMFRSSSGDPAGGQNGPNGPNGQRVHIQLLRDEQSKEKEFGRDVFISRLTILGAEKSDEGIYTCLAENAGGKDAVQMSLLVQKPGSRELLLQGNLAAVIGLMAVGLLSVTLFLAMVACCIYKRLVTSSAAHRHHHHHHHPHHPLDHGLTSVGTVVANHDATTVDGGMDSVLAAVNGVDDVTTAYKCRPSQQTTLNGGIGTGTGTGTGASKALIKDKYVEIVKEGHDGGSGTLVDGVRPFTGGCGKESGSGSGRISAGGGVDEKAALVDGAYLARSHEDVLHVRYPHGYAQAEIDHSATSHHQQSNDGKLTNGSVEFQPDLLANSQRVQAAERYSPLPTTTAAAPVAKTINPPDDQHHKQQQVPAEPQPAAASGTSGRDKFNTSAQQYLQTKLGATAARHGRREAPSIGVPLRHSKPLALTQRSNTATPTDSSAYEYRPPPPPPPYSAAHRSAANVLLARRTGVGAGASAGAGAGCGDGGCGIGSGDDNNRNNATIDQGYRECVGETTVPGGQRQTIVTASPSLNFPTTTTGYTTPRRQLL